MKNLSRILVGVLMLALLTVSCQKFEILNKDPNSLTQQDAAPDYLMANVLVGTAMDYGNLGSGIMSGAVQHTYQDAFGDAYSSYQWGTTDWSGIYGRLKDNQAMLQAAESNKWRFHKGVGLIMRAFNYGYIADFWGDAPYSKALKGDLDGVENRFPAFDSQESIYNGVIADLKAAIPLLAGSASDHPEITPVTNSSDVFYQGDPEKWSKLANSLLLRYYMRISAKRDVKADVEALANKVFESNDDDWAMPLPGVDAATSYQKSSAFGGPSNFNRNKMCATLVKKMDALKDPRIVIMAEPVAIRSKIDASKFDPSDDNNLASIIGGVRFINPTAAAKMRFKQFDINTYAKDRPRGEQLTNVLNFFDTSAVYVGIPISYSGYPDFTYNINGTGGQSNSNNSFVSFLRRSIYDNNNGPLLKQRMASYTEICFDLAEAAKKGWNVGGSAEAWYNKGVEASFGLWKVFSTYQSDVNDYAGCVKDFDSYISQPSVAYNGTLERIIEQKWIASWQASSEAFLDWRRTGYPALSVGYSSFRGAIPLRFAYHNTELQSNTVNTTSAIDKLEASPFVGPDGKNSPWSKFWLVQGTGKPW